MPVRLADVIARRAQDQPDRVALIFLDDGEREKERWTYAELDRRAHRVAQGLIDAGAAGRPVLLIFPSGLDFVAAFCGCLYAGAIAVPVPVPVGGGASRRLRSVFAACRPAVVFTTRALSGNDALTGLAVSGAALPILCIEDMSGGTGGGPLGAAEAALIQYTSGSTSQPKGVVIGQDALSANLEMIREALRLEPDSRFVSWLPLFHDMGLIFVVLEALWIGGLAVLMSPHAFLHNPMRWLRAIGRYRAAVSGAPNFAYDLCVRQSRRRAVPPLELDSWNVAFCGSETVRVETMEAFAAAFAPYGFRAEALWPGYGLAEATVFVSGVAVGSGVKTLELAGHADAGLTGQVASTRRVVNCGRAGPGQELAIVHPDSGAPLPDGQVGEIWVRGANVAAGYWNDPDATRATFKASLAGSTGPHFLRTGDLGFLSDGALYIAGRLKDSLLVRGANIDPGDIEATIARSHPALAAAGAAFMVDVGNTEQVAAVHELAPDSPSGLDVQDAVAAAFKAVNDDHGIRLFDLVLLRSGGLPRTTSGKVQRQACKQQYLAGTLAKVVPGADYRWLGRHRPG